MKFVHAADLHLDSPLRGLSRYDGAPEEEIRGATRRACENLVALCIDEGCDFLLLAGDLYDGDWRDYSTGLFFAAQMAKLKDAGVRVFSIRGNHDAQSRITKSLALPDNVVELATKKPQTIVDERLGVAVHGQGFATRAVTEDLARNYPDPVAGVLNVGLLHTCLDGREGHDRYAPTSVDVLRARGYDYWALGHVHAREVVARDPWIVFPGNLQGRHARETGPKGASLVTVSDDGDVIDVEHRPLDVVRWHAIEIDATDCATADEVVEALGRELDSAVEAAQNRLVAARVTIAGSTESHDTLRDDPERWTSEIQSAGLEIGADAVWIERVRFATTAPLDLVALRERDDPIGRLARTLATLRGDDAALDEFRADLADFEKKLPREAREGPDAIRLDDPDFLRAVLDDVEQTLLPRLLSKEET